MEREEISQKILAAAFKVHTKLGPGLLESVYEVILAHELRQSGLSVERQVPISIRYENLVFDEGFRADLIVESAIIVELKSVEKLLPVHAKQVLTQLKLANLPVGLLINFGETSLKNGIRRLINERPTPAKNTP